MSVDCLFVLICIGLFVCFNLFVCLPACFVLFVYLFVCLLIGLFVYLFVCLFVFVCLMDDPLSLSRPHLRVFLIKCTVTSHNITINCFLYNKRTMFVSTTTLSKCRKQLVSLDACASPPSKNV